MNDSLPLALLLGHAADAVQAVRSGQSLTEALARCPPAARPGSQALSFEVLRKLGTATAIRALLVRKAPQPTVDNVLLVALVLLLPTGTAALTADDEAGSDRSSYAPHTVVDQAVQAVRRRQPRSAGFANAVLRRFVRERDVLMQSVAGEVMASANHPLWWIDRLRADWPIHWPAIVAADNRRAPLALRVNRRHGSVDDYLARLAQAGIDARPLQVPGLADQAQALGHRADDAGAGASAARLRFR